MRSDGFSFYFGRLGVDLCFLDAAIVSATVRGTTAAGTLWPCLWGALQKRCATSFRVAGMALRDIPTCFITCQKSFFVTGTMLLHGFQTMICIFCGRHSALETSMFILRGRRSFGEDPSCVGCHAFFAAGAVFWTLSCLQLWRVECGV